MKRLLGSLAVVGALAAGSLTLSACDASPYAANVNGETISQLSLNQQLKQWSSNRTWVASFDSANAQQNGGAGTTVAGTGGQGTYSSTFVADILDNLIQVTVIRQHLTATHNLPTADETVASRAVNEFLRGNYWSEFSPSLRQFLVDQLAEQAPLTPVSSDTATLKSAYSQIQPYLFSQICLVEASAFDQSAAQQMSAAGNLRGAKVCYSQSDFENQPKSLQAAVQKLSVGQVSQPIHTSFGYQVVQLASRQTPGFSPGVQRVLSVATASKVPAAVTKLIDSAHVQVNPAYGTWSGGRITTPQLAKP
ncbi:MAG TPA: peptidylprolyl isomerase [Acidimicrobiales bacterium]|nr:peptidylprolyl isomerase [Acidimicrobiales bacterium]